MTRSADSLFRCVRPLGHKPGSYPGLSDRLVVSHYENNYGGAVRRLNAITKDLTMLPAAAAGYTRNGLKREELIAYNSMVLHEIHFEALGPRIDPPADFAAAVTRDFGSQAELEAQISTTAKSLAGGSGWVVLVREARDGRLAIQWSADHTMSFAGATPLFALDMYEHAYHMDFGANASAYVDAVLGMTDWTAPARRWRGEASITDPHAVDLTRARTFQGVWLDARRAPTWEMATTKLPGAVWRDPVDFERIAEGLSKDKPILAYCVHGFNFSRDAAQALRAQGFNASYLDVGSSGWIAMGLPVEPR